MKQREETLENTGNRRRNRLVGITVFVLGWGLMAALVLVWLAGSAGAITPAEASSADGAGAGTSVRKGWDGSVKGNSKLVSARQAVIRRTGKLKVRVTLRTTRRSPRALRRARVKVRLRVKGRKKPAPGSTFRKAGTVASARAAIRINRPRTITMKLNRLGRKMVADCGSPTFRATVRVRAPKGLHGTRALRARARKPARQQSLCAVPGDVDLSQGKKCEFIDDPANPCLGTFPNDFFTRPDRTSGTGLRLDINPDATPMNTSHRHIGVDSLNTSDGFSPGASIVLRIPGLDNRAAFDRSGLVGEPDMSQAFAPNQPAVLIDAKTGKRQLIWTELDSKATTDANRTLIVRPGRNLLDGHRYIFALRNLKDASGRGIEVPAGFRLYRDHDLTSNRLVESRRAGFESVFSTLGKAGIKRNSLYTAWDFTVASTKNITGRMISIRDRAFDLLGDHNLSDGSIDGTAAPDFTVTSVEDYSSQVPPYSGRGVQNIRTVTGTFQVPCYLQNPANPASPCASGATFRLDTDGLPIRQPGATYTARFTCNIPRSAVRKDGSDWVVDHPVRPSLYGHGLFGEYTEVNSTDIRQLGNEQGVMVCGTDWIGMADEDELGAGLPALLDFTKFPALPDRLQQGFLDFLYLGRLMIHPDGFASDPAFRFGPGENTTSVIDPANLFYYGNSQGGIAGGALTAVATDITRSVLYVGAMNYSTLLPRSVDFDEFEAIMNPSYRNEMERPLIFSLIQTMWDRGEPDGYANHITSDPLPDTPVHKVMMLMAYGDHQVANVATEVEARTLGLPLRRPVVGNPEGIPGTGNPPDRLAPGMINPWFDHAALGDLAGPAADGNALFVWDIGPKRMEGSPAKLFGTDPPPLANIPPVTSDSDGDGSDGSGIDPHDTVIRSSPLARQQIADFINTNGKVTDPCGSNPCWAAGWQGMP